MLQDRTNRLATARLLRQLAEACERGEFTEALVLTGHGGSLTGGARATVPGSRFTAAAKAIVESCGGIPCPNASDSAWRH